MSKMTHRSQCRRMLLLSNVLIVSSPAAALVLPSTSHNLKDNDNPSRTSWRRSPHQMPTPRPPHYRDAHRRPCRLDSTKQNHSDGESIETSQQVGFATAWLYKLNSSTKWLSALAHALAVWTRPHAFEGPFIVVGTILAATFTESYLKKIINQGRPQGAPFTDPGMPSSHSLVSFFAAVAWSSVIGRMNNTTTDVRAHALLLSAAALIAILRVLCGYHTVAQITVGAALGSLLGQSWFWFGETLRIANPHLTYVMSWCFYMGGSAIYIHKTMRTWVGKNAQL